MTPSPFAARARLARVVVCVVTLGVVAGCCAIPGFGLPDRPTHPSPPKPTTTISSATSTTSTPAGPGTDEPPPEAPPTKWGAALDGIADDGTVDLDLALTAFAIAVGPIPGVGDEADDLPVGDVPSGTGALRWLLGHWDDLSDEQRAAVAGALGEPDDDGADAAGPAPTASFHGRSRAVAPETCWADDVAHADTPAGQVEPYHDLVVEMTTTIGQKLGRTLSIPVYVQLRKQPLEGEAQTKAITVPWNADCARDQHALGCTILIPPAGRALETQERRALIAHEVMHCYQADTMTVAQLFALRPWVCEGMAEWVGETVSGGSKMGLDPWNVYLTTPGSSVFGQAYSARGAYDHLADTGVDPWTKLDPILAKGAANEPAFTVLAGAASTFLNTWPSGFTRTPDRGPAWDFTGTGIPSNHIAGGAKRFQPPSHAVKNGTTFTVDVAAAASSIRRLDIAADVVVVSGGVVGRLGPAGTTDVLLSGAPDRTFCTEPGGCVCPAGSAKQGEDFEELPKGPALHAVTGGTKTAHVQVVGESLDGFCDGDAPKQGPKAPVDNCNFVPIGDLEEIMGESLDDDASEPGYVCTFTTEHGESILLEVNPSLGDAVRDEYATTWPPPGAALLMLGDIGYVTYEQRGGLVDADGNPFPQHEGHTFFGLCTAKVLRGNVVVTVDMLSNGMPDTGMCTEVAAAALRQW